jgi:hypothetical protein
MAPKGCFAKYSFSVMILPNVNLSTDCTFLLTCVQFIFLQNYRESKMTDDMKLKDSDQAYAPASATSVQRTWKRACNWTPPSKDPDTIKKWLYYQSLSLLSAEQLQITKEAK